MGKIILAMISMIICASAMANGRHEGNLTSLEAGNTDGSIFFKTEERVQKYECISDSGYLVSGDQASDKILSILISAKISQARIYFDVNGCIGDYPKVTRVGLK